MKTIYLRILRLVCTGCLALGFLIMGVSSYTHYSTLGIDNERVQGAQVDYRYYRLWWPGNGALLIGWGETLKPYNSKLNYDLFDLAGSLFRAPHKLIEAQSFWNHLGFWWINKTNPRQFWIGVPALLPAILLIWLGWCFIKQARRS